MPIKDVIAAFPEAEPTIFAFVEHVLGIASRFRGASAGETLDFPFPQIPIDAVTFRRRLGERIQKLDVELREARRVITDARLAQHVESRPGACL